MKKWTTKRKNEIKHIIALVSAIMMVFILLLAGGISAYHAIRQGNQEKQRKEIQKYNVSEPNLEVALLSKNPNSRPGISLQQVNGVVIHYTANPGTDAMANRNYFESRKNMPDVNQNKVSSHFVIGLTGQIVQCIPLNEIAYASNDRNRDTISIECCHPDSSGKFSKETKQSLIHLTAWLCGKYGIQKRDIIRHYDVTGKECPKYYVKHPKKWEALRDEIEDYMKSF